ncbi:MAG: RnfABCDGE type electron transport complex subunit B [Oscillospiraceae bacterium]|jgi:Na+-translocating ferredoxin:NAD+ oxidoreductase RNF subunit RnfB|nr:RnfABCDGE type electron transport complex subunit B [Oscillospiraceae bacterium]
MTINVLFAVLVLGGLGGVLALVLGGASQVLAVEKDERLDDVLAALPGANCGGCGYAGCAALAEALVAGQADVGACPVGGAATAEALAALLGVELKKNTRLTALVRCSGGVRARRKFDYVGLPDCVAAMRLGDGGPLECSYGCIGLGSCVAACPFGAISVRDDVAVVDHERCTGCLTCTKVCPKSLIIPVPYYADIVVACSSHERGGVLRKVCDIGCLGCRICEKICKHGAVTITDSLASIDYEKCVSCGDCAEKCPRRLIVDTNLDRGPRRLSEAD